MGSKGWVMRCVLLFNDYTDIGMDLVKLGVVSERKLTDLGGKCKTFHLY